MTPYINHQQSKEHLGHRVQSDQRCCQCTPGQDQPRPSARGMVEVAKAAQNTSRGPRQKPQLGAVCMFTCDPFCAHGGNKWLMARIALCCTCCSALTATELGGNSHYTLKGHTRKHIFNCPQEMLNPAWEVEEADAYCIPILSSFSNSLVPMSFPTAQP